MNSPYLIEVDHDSILFGWQAVPDVIEYELQMQTKTIVDKLFEDGRDDKQEESEWKTLTSSLNGTEARKKNVDHLHTYRFRIRPRYSSGWDLFSEPSDFYSPAHPDNSILEPPVVMDRDTSSITLKWNEVEGAKGFMLRYRVASCAKFEWHTVDNVLNTNTVRKKGLTSNEGYFFSVKPVMDDDDNTSWVFSRSSLRCSPKDVPLHNAKCGYATVQGRRDWLVAHGVTQSKDIANITDSLAADRNPEAPLYYWQLFSLLGLERIHHLVKLFYKRVYADEEEEWFRHAFTRISDIDHHVATQTQFWVDVMGGGKYYHGGDYRLNFHHTHNADSVMNAKGAQRWMHHMRLAVEDNEKNPETSFALIDKRILPCLKDFLRTKMLKYSKEHDWKFDNSDFENFPE